MSLYDYEASKRLARSDAPFYALVMAAMRGADTNNLARLREAFPDTWQELAARYNAPGGLLPDELDTRTARDEAAHAQAEAEAYGSW